MGKILIVGDSLTAGHPGTAYVSFLKKSLSSEIIASGRGGDTLSGIATRTTNLLRRFRPEILLIQAGTNDILLPILQSRGGQWASTVRRMCFLGVTPAADASEFYENYRSFLTEINKRFSQEIILTTISCIGEDTTSVYNAMRDSYNTAIRTLGREFNLPVADTSLKFDEILKKHNPGGSYLLNDYWSTLSDTFFSLSRQVINYISESRGLLLTVDGVHLNPKGAEIYAREIIDTVGSLT